MYRNVILTRFTDTGTQAQAWNLGRLNALTVEAPATANRIRRMAIARLGADWAYVGEGWLEGPDGQTAILSQGLRDPSCV